MSLTDPKTYASGDVLTAADLNTYQRDNMRWVIHDSASGIGAPAARLWRSTDQTALTSGENIAFTDATGGSPGFDGRGSLVSASSPYTLQPPLYGMYLVGAAAVVRGTYDGSGTGTVSLRINADAGDLVNDTKICEFASQRAFTLGAVTLVVSTGWVNEEFSAYVVFTNQSNVDVAATDPYSPILWAIWLGTDN